MKKILKGIFLNTFVYFSGFHWPICCIARWINPNSALAILGHLKYGPDRKETLRRIANNVDSFPRQLYSEIGLAVVRHEQLLAELHQFTDVVLFEIIIATLCRASFEDFKKAVYVFLNCHCPTGDEHNDQLDQANGSFLAVLLVELGNQSADFYRLRFIEDLISREVCKVDEGDNADTDEEIDIPGWQSNC